MGGGNRVRHRPKKGSLTGMATKPKCQSDGRTGREWTGGATIIGRGVYWRGLVRQSPASAEGGSFSCSCDEGDTGQPKSRSPANYWHINRYIIANVSLNNACITLNYRTKVAERVGFEPTIPRGYTGFRDRRFRPLSHLSAQLNRGTLVHPYAIATIKL